MKPILILQHGWLDGPGHFGEWLWLRGFRAIRVRTWLDEPVPARAADFAGLCVLGGVMSANDEDRAHIRAELALLADARATGIPLIGHCLGGQMLARIAGGQVGAAPVPELGWQTLEVQPGAGPRRWFGAFADSSELRVMQWHYERFTYPPGALPLARSAACLEQAFELDGIHLGMQFHIEADAPKAVAWGASDRGELARWSHLDSVQTAQALAADTPSCAEAARRVAHRLYDVWAQALRH